VNDDIGCDQQQGNGDGCDRERRQRQVGAAVVSQSADGCWMRSPLSSVSANAQTASFTGFRSADMAHTGSAAVAIPHPAHLGRQRDRLCARPPPWTETGSRSPPMAATLCCMPNASEVGTSHSNT
jgi:hypothetical protein